MGCTLGKLPTYSPPPRIERLKSENEYVRRGRPIDRNQIPKASAAAAVPINCQKVEDKHIVGVVNTERGGGGDRVVVREREEKSGNAPKRVRSKNIGGDELVGRWPKWLVDNVPADLLSGLVSKSADSYDKLAKFFTSSPLACNLSALPIPRKEKDQSKTRDRNMRRNKTKQSTRLKFDGHQGKKLINEQPTEDFDSNKEEKKAEAQIQIQKMGYSGSSASSSVTTFWTERNSDSSLSPVGRSDKKRGPITQVHPNAFKNIKNPTLLQASIIDIIPNDGKILPHYRRSLSSVDFQSLNLEKISKLYEFDKDKAIKDDPP